MASRKKPTTAKPHTTEDFAPQMSEIIEKEPVVIEEKDILTENEVKDLEPEEVVEVKAPIVEIKPAKKAKKTEKTDGLFQNCQSDLGFRRIRKPLMKHSMSTDKKQQP